MSNYALQLSNTSAVHSICQNFQRDIDLIPADIVQEGNNIVIQINKWQEKYGRPQLKETLKQVNQHPEFLVKQNCNMTSSQKERFHFAQGALSLLQEAEKFSPHNKKPGNLQHDIAAFDNNSQPRFTLAKAVGWSCVLVSVISVLAHSAGDI